MTDLVERLRTGVYGVNRIPLCAEAADEIERLRAEIASARTRYQWLLSWLIDQSLLRAHRCQPTPEVEAGDYWVLQSPANGSCVGYGKSEDAAIDKAMADAEKPE